MSPIPSESNKPKPIADFTVPERNEPASVIPKCNGLSICEARLEDIVDPIDVAVIGCVVNGPGEAKAVSVGLTGGSPNLLYINGKTHSKIENASLVDELEALTTIGIVLTTL